MPSAEHQSLVRLITEGPGVLREVLALVGIEVPDDLLLRPGPDAVRHGDWADLFPDGTVIAHRVSDGADEEVMVLEVQLEKKQSKPYSWLVYVAVTHRRFRCPTTLVVVSPYESVARWAAEPIVVGRGLVLRPVVIGPRQIPHDLSLEQSRKVPAVAVLAVAAHGRGPYAERVGRQALQAVLPMIVGEDERAGLYLDVIHAYLDETVRTRIMEDPMWQKPYEPISDYFKTLRATAIAEGKAEGRAEGKAEGRAEGRAEGMVEARAEAILMVLDDRGIRLTARDRARIVECSDAAMLGVWLRRALSVTRSSELFESTAS